MKKVCISCKKEFEEKEGYSWVRCWDCYSAFKKAEEDSYDWGALDDDFQMGC